MMQFDLEGQPGIVQQVASHALQGWSLAKGWLLRPVAWMQFGLLVAACLPALIDTARRFVLSFAPPVLPLLARIFSPKALVAVRNALKDNDIGIPYPNLVVALKGGLPGISS
ncbi:hypothetical protein SAMN05216236_11317 [Sedimentitalea nanhaiensis]|uniref:Uncharacterized protein n=2 Tax=Sedimentitalea nanhaiensis TaxID=999627 RepID=A0A1I7BYM5_9RHOB|nr:hypothetical protein SAMN05216236_11317 [Sedimentitalea nanhaiensis]